MALASRNVVNSSSRRRVLLATASSHGAVKGKPGGVGVPRAPGAGGLLRAPVEVMLARPVDRLPAANALPGGVQYEQKWDGYRVVAFGGDDVYLQSRRGANLTAAFPEVAGAVGQLPSCVVDGEVVIWGDGALDFPALLQRMGSSRSKARRLAAARPASFVVFDVLALDGTDLRRQPLRQRRQRLGELLADVGSELVLAPATLDRAEASEWLSRYAAAQVGIEGIVAKGLGQPYREGQRGWLKYRYRQTVEVIVGAVMGSVARPERLVLGLYQDQALQIVGGTSGLTDEQQRSLAPLLVEAGDDHPWPSTLGGGHVGYWGRHDVAVVRVVPDVVVEIAADNAFEHGRWRHVAAFVRVRPDLTPAETEWPRGRAYSEER